MYPYRVPLPEYCEYMWPSEQKPCSLVHTSNCNFTELLAYKVVRNVTQS